MKRKISTEEEVQQATKKSIKDMITRVFAGSVPENVMYKLVSEVHGYYTELAQVLFEAQNNTE